MKPRKRSPGPNLRWPRDEPGSIEFTEGTGGILDMCPCGDFMEVYKEDTTFRLQTPETVDPERTNPHAPFVAMVAERIGTSNPVIARVLLQGRDILDTAFLPPSVEKERVVLCLHEIKEALIACHKASEEVVQQIGQLRDVIKSEGVAKDNRGRTLPSLPQVADLDALCTQYLISAKRAIKGICRLPSLFTTLDGDDNNFDHLARRLDRLIGGDHAVTKFVRGGADVVRYLIELRNAQEHPKPDHRTVIENFRVLPDGSIREPVWYLTGEEPAGIAAEMPAGIDRMVEIAEEMLIYLVDWQLDARLPFVFQRLADAEVDPKKPIRYRLTIDAGVLRIDRGESGDSKGV